MFYDIQVNGKLLDNKKIHTSRARFFIQHNINFTYFTLLTGVPSGEFFGDSDPVFKIPFLPITDLAGVEMELFLIPLFGVVDRFTNPSLGFFAGATITLGVEVAKLAFFCGVIEGIDVFVAFAVGVDALDFLAAGGASGVNAPFLFIFLKLSQL